MRKRKIAYSKRCKVSPKETTISLNHAKKRAFGKKEPTQKKAVLVHFRI